ncbi:YibE/F family protein [Patescibacteria group bacterium]
MKNKLILLTTVALVFTLFGLKHTSAQETPIPQDEGVLPEDFIPTETPENYNPQQESMKGTIVGVFEEGVKEVYGQQHEFQTLKVKITKGSLKNQEVDVLHGILPEAGAPKYKNGDKVYLIKALAPTGEEVLYITDYSRTENLLVLFVLFAGLVIIVSRWWGVSSLVGLFYAAVIIFKFLLPRIANGDNPILMAILAASFIAPVTFYLSHGLNKKTSIALVGTLISLLITGFLAAVFVKLTNLTGFGSEEALFLQVATGGSINIKGLLMAGIIIGSLGILDDVTITQASIVFQLKKTDKKLNATKLFQRAIDLGHDHIASTVNTLVLVYTGAAMPLLLLFINNPITTTELINSEIISEEIVRTLVSSIGLILAIPITTLLASLTLTGKGASTKV